MMGSNETRCPMVFACDDAYAMPLATVLRSIVEANTNAWPCEFHVLTDSISADNQERIFKSLPSGSASIRWVNVDINSFNKFQTLGHISKITYARLLMPYVFPEAVSKVLYLDADTLVLDNLQPLWEADLHGLAVGAVLDPIVLGHIKRPEPGWENIPRVRDYFNAGVLLIDLKRWRELRVSEKAVEYLQAHPESPFSDQDALNVACDGLWTKLDPRWNFLGCYKGKKLSQLSAEALPSIVHFVTYDKPWNAGLLNINAEFYDVFRSRTYFARTPLDKQRDAILSGWIRLKRTLKSWLKPQPKKA
jgi:lipopolysaccharide biosynthesis glycosyltransferase